MLRKSIRATIGVSCLALFASTSVAQGDDCNSALAISDPGTYGIVTVIPYSTAGFTIPGPVVSCNGIPDPVDGYFLYFAAISGTATFSVCASSGIAPGGSCLDSNTLTPHDSVMAAFDAAFGCPIGGPELVCNDDACAGALQSEISFPVTVGNSYYVMIGDWTGGAPGMVGNLAFVVNSPLGNDECTGAIPLPTVAGFGTPGFVGVDPMTIVNPGLSNVGSSASIDQGTCYGNSEPDAWYSYTALNTGVVEFSTCFNDGGAIGSLNTMNISAWDGICGGLLQVACNSVDWRNGFGCGNAARLQANITAGQTIYVAVSGFLGSQGTFDLAVTEFPSQPGNTCANPIALAGNGTYFIDTTSDGIASDGLEPSCQVGGPAQLNGNYVGAYHTWTAPCNGGTAILSCCPTTGFFGGDDTLIMVYDSCGGVEIACNDDAPFGECGPGNFKSHLTFPVTPGTTYYLVLGGWQGDQGPITFTIECDYRHDWTVPSGPGSIQLENVDGPAFAVAYSAVTLDVLHPGLPPAQTFPNGWFFGIPIDLIEIITQLTWPGGAPFLVGLDGTGYALNISAPAGSTSGLIGATIWSVGVAFDPASGFAVVSDVTDPTAFFISS